MYRIGEVAERLGVGAHVVRHWDSPMLSGTRDAGGHRRYTERDVELLERVQVYVQRRGFTVEGAWDAVADDLLRDHREGELLRDLKSGLRQLLHRSLRIASESAGRPLLSVNLTRVEPGEEEEPDQLRLGPGAAELHGTILRVLRAGDRRATAIWPPDAEHNLPVARDHERAAASWLRARGGGIGVFVRRGGPATRQGLHANWPVLLVPGPRLVELLPCFETPDTEEDVLSDPWLARSPSRILLALPHTVAFRGPDAVTERSAGPPAAPLTGV